MDTKNFIGSIFLEKYKIIKLIEKGGMDSEIYLAQNIDYSDFTYFSKKHKFSAIKIIRKSQDTTSDHWNRILDEGVTNARLNVSDYVVKLYDLWSDENKETVILVLEYIDGPSLKNLIREKGNLSTFESLWIFEKILFGVRDMHQKDRMIIHRDLKPENILLSKDLMDVKIADFGISSVVLKKTNNKEILTNENNFFGTIPYLTPDVSKRHFIDGKEVPIITKQYDFHALGIILYEMLVGEKPFDITDENNPKIIFYYKKFDITPLFKINKNIYPEIENIFLKLTSSSDDDLIHRYYDVEDIIMDVQIAIKSINNSINNKKTIKPYFNRNYQKHILVEYKNKFNFWRYIFKNKFLFLIIIFSISVFIIFFVFLIWITASKQW